MLMYGEQDETLTHLRHLASNVVGPGRNPAQRQLPHVLQRSGDVAQDRGLPGTGE